MQERKKRIALAAFYLKPQHTRKVLLVFVVECRWMAAIKSDIGKKQSNHWVGHIQNILYQDWGGAGSTLGHMLLPTKCFWTVFMYPSLPYIWLIWYISNLFLYSDCFLIFPWKSYVRLYIFVFAIHNRCWGVPLRSLYLASASILCWAALPMRLPAYFKGQPIINDWQMWGSKGLLPYLEGGKYHNAIYASEFVLHPLLLGNLT